MKGSLQLNERKSTARTLNLVGAAGIILLVAAAATAAVFAQGNIQQDTSVAPAMVDQPA